MDRIKKKHSNDLSSFIVKISWLSIFVVSGILWYFQNKFDLGNLNWLEIMMLVFSSEYVVEGTQKFLQGIME